jgi:hypothetical protein
VTQQTFSVSQLLAEIEETISTSLPGRWLVVGLTQLAMIASP